MDEQVINTGDPALDQQIAGEIAKGIEAGGLKVELKPAAGGGIAIRTIMPAPIQAVAAAPVPGVSAEALKPGAFELGGTEGWDLKQEVLEGNFTGLRKLLADTRASKDWDDRHFMLDIVIGSTLPGSLDQAVAKEPAAVDLLLCRGAYAVHQAWLARGGSTADEVSDEQWARAREWVGKAKADLARVTAADTADPTPCAFLMRGALIFDSDEQTFLESYAEAVRRAPEFVAARAQMVNQKSEKWGGSHEESLAVAREAAARGARGGDAPFCLFQAHLLVFQYLKYFDQDDAAATAYLARPDVRAELERTFDAWTGGGYTPKRSSIARLNWPAFWFFRTGDRARLKKALGFTNNIFCSMPWDYDGGAMAYTQAVQQTMSGT
jgi:hypothetical protein